MRGKKGSFNINLLGSWNPAIFKTEWLLKNVCDSDNGNVSIAYPMEDLTGPRKIDFEGISLFPSAKQLLIGSENATREGMQKSQKVLTKILGLLVHTPVTFCGINFTFVETNATAPLFNVLNTIDKTNIAKNGYSIQNSSLTHRVRIQNRAYLLNYTISDVDGVATISFNFHYELNDIQKYSTAFNDGEALHRF